jgi:hypothetical protein
LENLQSLPILLPAAKGKGLEIRGRLSTQAGKLSTPYPFASCTRTCSFGWIFIDFIVLIYGHVDGVVGTVYDLQFDNQSGSQLDGFMIQFNSNSQGLVPANQVLAIQTLSPGDSANTAVPLIQSQTMMSPAGSSDILQVPTFPSIR